tara:strand:+ start:716 stop:883 length:168 start_codon:yes stop_codon:yes gene_type:complete
MGYAEKIFYDFEILDTVYVHCMVAIVKPIGNEMVEYIGQPPLFSSHELMDHFWKN